MTSDFPAPDGGLAIAFSDIEESTAIWETAPESMRTALQMHDDILRAEISRHQGYEVKVIGDGFMVAFQTAVQALAWCLDVQCRLLEADWPPEIVETPYAKKLCDKDGKVVFRGLTVRMSIHWGSPIVLLNRIANRMEYIGPMVHRTARCMSIAKGGQIVVTRGFLHEIRRRLEEAEVNGTHESNDISDNARLASSAMHELSKQDFDVKNLGQHKLKGLSDPLKLYLITPGSLRGRLEHYSPPSDQASSVIWNWIDWVAETLGPEDCERKNALM